MAVDQISDLAYDIERFANSTAHALKLVKKVLQETRNDEASESVHILDDTDVINKMGHDAGKIPAAPSSDPWEGVLPAGYGRCADGSCATY
ncbi:hypothetical protein chiPu_0016490 [Chiloscyllium punctatum]|uniref:Uncharacterized protein n=1 Tax=Chiloscyllium punctatum TaxID=137246 RepID=A0A401T5Q7_CHIPU|nr:hypothetical protein [Chiloscyllium punctatum]